MFEAFGLAWLAGVIGSVLTDSLKERLKPASRDEKARDLAFGLFQALQALARTTREFVDALGAYAKLVEGGVSLSVERLGGLTLPDYALREEDLSADEAARQRLDLLRSVNSASHLPEEPNTVDVEIVNAQATLWKTTAELRRALEALQPALKRIDPQLAVHQPDVSDAVNRYVNSRALVMAKLEDLAWVSSADVGELQQIVEDARANQTVIDGGVADFRSFLASEFSFKESF
jgi:hypothetical protein